MLLLGGCFVEAQETEETVRVRTRVVFLDALVRDKRSSSIVADLKQNDFEVLADGKPRALTYFNREGDAGRRPLALVLVLDLNRIGAGRFLRRTEILEALAMELAKLPPGDEVAVMALDVGGTGNREWLTRFTRDRAQIVAALSVVPLLVAAGASSTAPPPPPPPQAPQHGGAETQAPAPQPPAAEKPPTDHDEDDDEDDARTIKLKTVNKDGSVTIKWVNKDGAMVTKTINKDGTENTDHEYGFEFSAGVHEVALSNMAERPNSQAAIVLLSDGITPVEYEDRDQAVASLIQTNTIFSALITDMKTGFKLFKPILKPLGNWAGISIYGTSQHVAKQTGGESIGVRRPEDYARGLGKIIGNLTGRYSLGFTLAETEQDDGQMHALEVRVKARDAKGKARKLDVTTRRGFYMPKENESAKAAPPVSPKATQ